MVLLSFYFMMADYDVCINRFSNDGQGLLVYNIRQKEK